MENLTINKPSSSLFAFFNNVENKKVGKMLYIKVKKYLLCSIMLFLVSSVLFATDSYALFEELSGAGRDIFGGMKEIIYAVAGFGIVGIAMGGFFGNLNWKWLFAVILGLIVISATAALLVQMVGENDISTKYISDTLIEGNSAKVKTE